MSPSLCVARQLPVLSFSSFSWIPPEVSTLVGSLSSLRFLIVRGGFLLSVFQVGHTPPYFYFRGRAHVAPRQPNFPYRTCFNNTGTLIFLLSPPSSSVSPVPSNPPSVTAETLPSFFLFCIAAHFGWLPYSLH